MPRVTASSRADAADFIPPMKALGVTSIPAGTWRLEVKLDGYRAIAVVNAGRVQLWSRNHKPLTADYPEVVAALEKLRCRSVVLDGEIVALDPEGRSRFQLLQRRGAETRPPIVYYLFDLLQRDGKSLVAKPLTERRNQLEALVKKPSAAGTLRLSPVFELNPATLLGEVRKQGLEGIVAKAPDSPYEPDRRSGAWLKCRVTNEQEFVIGGFTPPRNSRTHFGAILVGYYADGELLYAGKVGSGFDAALLASLHEKFEQRRTPTCPFANLPLERRPRFGTGMTAAEMKAVTWTRPALVAQIRFAEWTHDGLLRQPVFLGLRKDKPAKAVVREAGVQAH